LGTSADLSGTAETHPAEQNPLGEQGHHSAVEMTEIIETIDNLGGTVLPAGRPTKEVTEKLSKP